MTFAKAVMTPQNNDPVIVIVVLQVFGEVLSPGPTLVCYDRSMPCMANSSDGSLFVENV